MKLVPMNIKKSQSLFGQTVALTIATASLLVSIPTHAQPSDTNLPTTTPKSSDNTNQTNPPSLNSPTTTPASPETNTSQAGTIVDVAASNPHFKTLVTAIKAAGLTQTLSGNGPFTVFAPTDAAFAKLPKGTLQKLLKPENKATLQKVLGYHVVSGEVDSSALKSGPVSTVEGDSLNVQVVNGHVKVNTATVVKANIKASNGVIHAINTVLLPPGVQ